MALCAVVILPLALMVGTTTKLASRMCGEPKRQFPRVYASSMNLKKIRSISVDGIQHSATLKPYQLFLYRSMAVLSQFIFFGQDEWNGQTIFRAPWFHLGGTSGSHCNYWNSGGSTPSRRSSGT
jgi:hypothetical protein